MKALGGREKRVVRKGGRRGRAEGEGLGREDETYRIEAS